MDLVKTHLALIFFKIFRTTVCDEIDADYYFGFGALRSDLDKHSCHNGVFQTICHLKCGENHACFKGTCYCFRSSVDENDDKHLYPRVIDDSEEQLVSDFIDYAEITPMKLFNKVKDPIEKKHRPALRHHIAHFCPNLDEARVCIKKCMKVGKPAFCGKDHVCYCGHETDDPKYAMKVNAADTYAQFKDLYEKYFGQRLGKEPNNATPNHEEVVIISSEESQEI